GEHDVDRVLALARGLKQQLDEGRGLVAVLLARGDAREAEQLLELVNDDEQTLVRRHSVLAHGLDESEASAPERGLRDGRLNLRALFYLGAEDARRAQRPGEVAERVVAR